MAWLYACGGEGIGKASARHGLALRVEVGGGVSGRLQPGVAWLYSPMTSVPLGGAKLKVPAAKDGLRFQPVKLITVR